jgi:hypothetical protein
MGQSRRGGNQFFQIFETDGREHFARFGAHARKLKLRRGNASGFRAKRQQNPASFFH